jgi:hypothetical protein
MARTLTFRTVFERASILKLSEEPELEHNHTLKTLREGYAPFDHYLGVFVFTAESQDDGSLLLRAVSTTVVGIQRFTTKRLQLQAVYVAASPLERDGPFAATLRAHYRAADE